MKNIIFISLFPALSILGASFPEKLSSAKEKELIEKYSKGDMDAKNKLIEHNLRLVAHICKKYSSSGMDNEDLISIGTIGLIKGLSSYNPQKGTRLATYTARCIENAILIKCPPNYFKLKSSHKSDARGFLLNFISVINIYFFYVVIFAQTHKNIAHAFLLVNAAEFKVYLHAFRFAVI